MKKITLLCFLIFSSFAFSQVWSTGTVNLDGSNFSVELDITSTDVTITMIGPDDVYLAVGFGVTTMTNGGDLVVYDSTGFRDMTFQGVNVFPIDDTQDWTVNTNSMSGGLRTIEATRSLSSTGDYTFSTTDTSVNLVWAKGNGTLALGNHGFGATRRGATTAGIVLSDGSFQSNPAEFSLSPNPSSRDLNIGVQYNLSNNFEVQVFDVLGKQIYRGQLVQERTTLDVSSWRTGIYLVKVTSDSATQTKRFIKQ